MKHGVYVYLDKVAESPIQPILLVAPNDETATRDFVQLLLSENFQKGKNIGDFNLIRLGSYDLMLNRLCEVAGDPTGHPLCTGVQVREMVREQKRRQEAGVQEEATDEGEAAALRLATPA